MIHAQLKKLRHKHNLSQEQLAEELCISQSTYARLENGSSNWAKYLEKICKYFNLDAVKLFPTNENDVNNNAQNKLNYPVDLIEQILKYEDKLDAQQNLIIQLVRKIDSLEKRTL